MNILRQVHDEFGYTIVLFKCRFCSYEFQDKLGFVVLEEEVTNKVCPSCGKCDLDV